MILTSRGDRRELPDGRTESREERRDCLPAECGHMVTMRPGDLADQSVRTKQAQLATDPGRASAPLRAVCSRVGEEESLQIPVPKPVQSELPATHGGQQGSVVGVERTECPDPAAVPGGGLAEAAEQFGQRGVVIDTGQGVQVALGALARDPPGMFE